jgi:hypothetical protein
MGNGSLFRGGATEVTGMSGVFLSYSRADRALADAIIRGLRAVGVVVWWDEDMRSIDWHQELERQIVELASIVVLWTPSSSTSDHVKDEARLGLESNKLINVIVGLPKPPFPYDRVNGLPLDGWTEREPNRGWTRLIETIEEKVVAKGGATPGELTGALARREEGLRLKQQALARAQEALEEAQAREAETIDAAQVAQATFTRAEEQHLRVMEMRATHLIMSAAAQEYEAARAAKEDADRAQRAAKTEVKGVAREVALAIAALESPDSATAQRRPKSATPPVTAKAPEAEAPPPAAAPSVEPEKPAAKAAPKPAPEAAPSPAAAVTPPTAASPPAATAPVTPAAAAPVAPAAAAATAPSPVAAAAASPVAAVKPAVAVTPAAATASAGAAAPATGSSGRPLIFVAVGVLVLALLAGAGWFVLKPHPKPAAPAASSSLAVATPAASTPGPAVTTPTVDPTAAAVKAAAPIAGNWAAQGLSCDSPIVIAVTNGAVSMTVAGTTSTAAIEPSSTSGVINARGEDGGKYTYSLGQDNSLSMVDPTNQTMKMTKCAG